MIGIIPIIAIIIAVSVSLWFFLGFNILTIIGLPVWVLGWNMVYPYFFIIPIFGGIYLGYPGAEDGLWFALWLKFGRFFGWSKIKRVGLAFITWFIWKSVIATAFLRLGEKMIGLSPVYSTKIMSVLSSTYILPGFSITTVFGILTIIPAGYIIYKELKNDEG